MSTFEVVVTHDAENKVTVTPPRLMVQVAASEPVTVTWSPGTDTLITGVSEFPTEVDVSGPDEQGRWTASYSAPGDAALWSYTVASQHTTGLRNTRKDPEIDNTPPPL